MDIFFHQARRRRAATIDIPLAHKDALYVRSHYDGISITLHDAPLPDEIAMICAYATRGRPNHRVGGLERGRDQRDRWTYLRVPERACGRLMESEHERLQDRRRAHQVAQGRTHRLSRRQACRRCHRASGVSQRRTLGSGALRFPGAAGKSRADDVSPERLQPPRQSRLADAAQLRRDGAAAQGAAGLGGAILRLFRALAGSSCVLAGRPAHGHRGVPQAQPRARQGVRRLFRLRHARTICFSPT